MDTPPPTKRPCQIARTANALARRARICEQCGGSFIEKTRSARQIAEGKKQRFCSNACSAGSRKVYASRAEQKRAAKQREKAARPPRPKRAPKIKEPKPPLTLHRMCSWCNTAFQQIAQKGRNSSFCCEECRDAKQRQHRRIQSKARDARLRGSEKVERVDPFEVLARDRWRCQLCGKRTPKRLRGTIDLAAPEVDHIMPVSKGGMHTLANVHCACRECNRKKNNKPLGQMRLFG